MPKKRASGRPKKALGRPKKPKGIPSVPGKLGIPDAGAGMGMPGISGRKKPKFSI